MDVEEVIDEVLEIERSMRMDMAQLGVQEGVEEVIQSPQPLQEQSHDVAQVITIETEVTDESDEALTPEAHSTDAELSPTGDGSEVTFVVQLNDEGAILLDKRGVVPSDAEPHVYFPIKLPATKVKSAENPLVGAKHFPTTRSRKTKPQAILYNDEIDQIYEILPDGNLNSITTSSGEDVTPVNEVILGESMDVSDFASRLLPKDFELMENLLANQEVLEISGPTKPTPTERKIQTVEVHYDHNYAAEILEPRPKTIITVISDGHAKSAKNIPRQMISDPSDATLVHVTNRSVVQTVTVLPGPKHFEPIRTEDTEERPARTTEGVSPGITSSEASARARRSQRQQDRIERQEAERILAENQQMLQREKEMYGKPPISPSTSTNSPTAPAAVALPISLPSLGPVEKPLTTPVSTKVKGKTVTSTEEDPNSSRRPYPKRQNRKLPAHLADPNYINLDESEKKSQEEVAEGEDDDDDKDPDGEKEISEDDPNKLWCICRKPHNNRFMICCDTCEDWFHGKCVGITKAKGSKLDKWVCPNCRKQKKTDKETLQTPVAQVGRGGRGSNLVKSNQGKSVKGRKLVTTGDKEDDNDKTQPTPEKLRQRKTTGERQNPTLTLDVTPTTSEKCIICKTKPSRKDSIFCSDECVVKHSQDAGTGPAVTNVPTKLKRSVSRVADKEELENFLTFHVISAGTPKSTVVVPPKPKEVTPSILVKSSPTKSPNTSDSAPSVSSTNGKPLSNSKTEKSASGKRGSLSQGSSETKRTKLTEATPLSSKRSTRPSITRSNSHTSASKSGTSTEGKPTRKRLSSETKDKDAKSKQKEAENSKKETEKQRKETEAEIAACRETSRLKLTEVFEARLKELTETERAEIPVENTPEFISLAIEIELFSSFSGVNNKYKSKFRSILFNLKDSKNNLYKTISMNELKPSELVKLEPHQLASDELAQWRINESKKELEMIKRSEIDKLEELKKQERIDAELGFEKISTGEDEVRSLGTAHADRRTDSGGISEPNTPSRASTRSSSRHKSHSRSHERSKSTDKRIPSRSRSHGGKADDPKRESSQTNTNSSRQTRSSEKGIEKKAETSSKEVPTKEEKKARHKSSSKHSSSRSSPSAQQDSSSSLKEKDKDNSPKEKESERNLRSRDKSRSSTASSQKRSHRDSDKKKESSRNEKRKNSSTEEERKTKNLSCDDHKLPRKETNVKDSSSVAPSDISTDDNKSTQPTVDAQPAVADSNIGLRISIDSTTDQELPSSTIKTPDFTTEEISTQQSGENVEVQKPVLESSFTMPELGNFNAVLYNVSHFSLAGIFFPASPVPIVGRIHPGIVWDYIDKMKKTKEVIILRLAPATPADTEGYMTFFTYFSSRTRIGVLGGLISPLKDVYLVPLDKHSPVNKVLLPLHGPGLPKKRAHCLLAVITRHSIDIPAPLSRRKLSSSSDSPLKRMKLTSDIKPGLISSLNLTPSQGRRGVGSPSLSSKKSPDDKISPFEESTENSQVNDDDLPYTPWEEEEGSSPVSTDANLLTVQTRKKVITDPKILQHIQELDAQIQVEQAAIENMELAIIAKTHEDPLIPGLDGEFAAEASTFSSFLRPFSATRVQSTTAEVAKPSGALFSVVPSLSLLSGEGSSSAPPSSKELLETVTVIEIEDDAPYSPSQLDLDEETES